MRPGDLLYLSEQLLLSPLDGAGPGAVTRFQIHRFIGQGGSSRCYEAHHPNSGRGVLKEFFPLEYPSPFCNADQFSLVRSDLQRMYETFEAMLGDYLQSYREMLAIQQSDAPAARELASFIPPFELYRACDEQGVHTGTAYIWMPIPEYVTFDHVCQDIRRTPTENPRNKLALALKSIAELTACVLALHRNALLHRDIKPGNFGFLTRNTQLLEQTLSFFDLDTICSCYDAQGCPFSEGFSDPAVAGKYHIPCFADDIYSIGATLFHAIVILPDAPACYRPEDFDRLPQMIEDSLLIRACGEDAPPRLRRLLTDILQKCLGKRRYRDCEELLNTIHAALQLTLPARRSPIASRIPQPHGIFLGREREMARLHELLRQNRIVFIQGLAGIGKSEVAKQYAAQYHTVYDTILYTLYPGSLRQLFCDPTGIEIDGVQRRPDEPEDQFFLRKLQAFHAHADGRTLLIIDNFDVSDDPHWDALQNGACKILLTTRHLQPNAVTLPLSHMTDWETLKAIFEQHYGAPVLPEEEHALRTLFEEINYHTYTVELLARQMQASFLLPSDMLEIIRQKSLDVSATESFRSRGSYQTAFRHICTLFSVSDLSEEEQRIMLHMTITGIRGIPAARFREWAGLTDFNVVNQLISHSWIHRESDGTLLLHPLIQEMAHYVLAPSARKCRRFLTEMADFCDSHTARSDRENIAIGNCVESILSYFDPPSSEEFFFYARLTQFLIEIGWYEAAVPHCERLYEAAVAHYGAASYDAGYLAMRLGTSYAGAGRRQEASRWFRQGLMNMQQEETPGGDNPLEAAQQAAEALFEECLLPLQAHFADWISTKQPPVALQQPGHPAYFLAKALGCIYWNEQNAARACHYAQYATGLVEAAMPQRPLLLAAEYHNLSKCKYSLSMEESLSPPQRAEYLAEAETALQRALQIARKHRGEISIDVLTYTGNLADIHLAQDKLREARSGYVDALRIARRLLDKDHPQIQRIERQLRRLAAEELH